MTRSSHSDPYSLLTGAVVRARKNAGLRQVELATLLAKPQSFISKVETGERRLDVIEFLVIMKVMGASATDALAEIEEKVSLNIRI